MLALAAALVLAAQPSNAWLDDARGLVAQLKFSEALAQLEVARTVPGLDVPTQQAINELTAYCQVAEGRRDDAERTFIAMFELDPRVQLSKDAASPKVLELFAAAKKKHFPPDYVRLTEQPSPVGRAQLALVDPWRLVRDVVLHTRRDEGEWAQQPLDEDDGAHFAFALVVPVGGQLEWFVEARGADEVVLVTVGSREQPRVVRVPKVEQSAQGVLSSADATWSGKRIAGVIALGLGAVAAGVATGLEVDAWNQRVAARDRTRPPGDAAATALEAEKQGLAQQNVALGSFIAGGVLLGVGVVLAW